MIITIDTDAITAAANEAGGVVLTPEGEEQLLALKAARDAVNEAIELAKKNIEEAIIKHKPDTKGVESENFKISYRSFGARYKIDEANLEFIPPTLYNKSVTVRLTANSEAIDKYLEQNEGKLPLGVIVPDRPKRIILGFEEL